MAIAIIVAASAMSYLSGSSAWVAAFSMPRVVLAACLASRRTLGARGYVSRIVGADRHSFARFGCNAALEGSSPVTLFGSIDVGESGFCGTEPTYWEESDTETGLDFFQARYYSGSIGRFVSPDPAIASSL